MSPTRKVAATSGVIHVPPQHFSVTAANKLSNVTSDSRVFSVYGFFSSTSKNRYVIATIGFIWNWNTMNSILPSPRNELRM